MVRNDALQRRRDEDRRKNPDRRNGCDRRLNDQAVVIEDANGQDATLTTNEACEYLQISRPTYLKYITTGKIKAKKVGRGWRALKSELNKFLCEE